MRIRMTVVVVSIAIAYLLNVAAASAGEIVLAENGKSSYRIVVADDASTSTRHAADELQKYLEEITGAKLTIVSDKQPVGPAEIILGDNAHFRALNSGIDLASFGDEGYAIRTIGNHLIIVGGALRGNLYGVYGLLEDHLGCRWFTPEVSRIPKMPRLAISPMYELQMPALEYREPFVADCFDGEWCSHNRMNSSAAGLEEKHGGKVAFANGFFVHTFAGLVPPDKYFDEHPEYFSMVKGKRIKEGTQLCCTNPEVIRLCTEAVRDAMRQQPNATVFSVSQNDCQNYCECENCQALAKQEDSQMGPVLQLVNRVAEAVEKDFPDKIVETLAYQWTRRPTKHIRPRPNVVIRLCSIECCFSHPLADCNSKQNQDFRADLEAWSLVASRLWVWDYTTDFAAYLLPFPNQRVLSRNVHFFTARNVTGIFEEDAPDTKDSELAALGGYMMAKILWNPNYDPNKARDEFLEGFYGKAADPIRAYIDLIHDYVVRENIHVGIYVTAESKHITPELLAKASELWEQAENLAADDPASLKRVKIGRLSVDFAILERARLCAQGKEPANEPLSALAAARFQPFFNGLDLSAMTRLREGQPLDKEAYRCDLARNLGLEPKTQDN